MRSSFAALSLIAAFAMRAHGGELTVFYCYAPDTSSGVVYLSQPLPVGPVSERSGYGREFAAWLKSADRVRGDVAAYCVMRASHEEITRAQAALSTEACPECAGATRFEPVSWPRATGDVTPALAKHADQPVRPEPPAPTQSTRNVDGDLLVVMGNTETGKMLVVSNHPDAVSMARAQAKTIRATGWTTLLTTSEPGFGAAFCVRSGKAVRFFVAHAQPSMKDAIARAREFAAPYAAEISQEAKVCGAPWNARAPDSVERESGVIDDMKDAVRKEVACDPRAKSGDANARPCPKKDPSFTGVRG